LHQAKANKNRRDRIK